LLILINWLQIS